LSLRSCGFTRTREYLASCFNFATRARANQEISLVRRRRILARYASAIGTSARGIPLGLRRSRYIIRFTFVWVELTRQAAFSRARRSSRGSALWLSDAKVSLISSRADFNGCFSGPGVNLRRVRAERGKKIPLASSIPLIFLGQFVSRRISLASWRYRESRNPHRARETVNPEGITRSCFNERSLVSRHERNREKNRDNAMQNARRLRAHTRSVYVTFEKTSRSTRHVSLVA